MMRVTTRLLVAATFVAGASCSAPTSVQIDGAGATFPNPIYSKWFSECNKIHPNIQINYQPQGSGAGTRQVTNEGDRKH